MAADGRDQVEDLLAEYELALAQGTAPPFEEWAREHPSLTDALRRAWADSQRAARALAAGARSAGIDAGFRAGSRIGSYALVRLLGQGGQGSVWEAEQSALGRRVALKLLRATDVSGQHTRHFLQEARAGARLQHPGIVTVLDSGEINGTLWIAQELVPGGRTLRERLEEVRRATDPPADWYREVARLVRSVATALGQVHATGIVHRDIKPQNILLTPEGEPKVGDFGLARMDGASTLSRSGQVVGTYLYMSPEQVTARRGTVDRRADVFSLGVVLYELLTLTRPFAGDTAAQVCERILHDDPVDARVLRSQVPADLACIAAKCLEKEPARRYSSMADLAEDLRRHLSGEPIRARPAGPWERCLKWGRRHPTRSAAGAVALVAAACLVVLTWRLLVEQGRSRDLLALGGLRHLVARAEDLWPVSPAALGAYESWLDDAAELRQRVDDLRTRRGRLSSESGPAGVEQRVLLQSIEHSWQELFHPERGLAAGTSARFGPSVAVRARMAAEMQALLERHREAWSEATARIADREESPAYAGLRLTPVEGLLPLGPDPRSGLWEFAHLPSGRPAERGPDGKLVFEEGTGIVLVLVHGGHYLRGGQATDPDAPNFDPAAQPWDGPPLPTEVAPFFLSKYEMSQGQWLRWNGANPSRWHPGYDLPDVVFDLRFPVDQCSWEEAHATMAQMGLRLPTEAEWEYAARAGTTTVWWTGDARESLRSAANLCDRTAIDHKEPWSPCCEWLDDSYLVTAPVDSLRPNPFGLHHVHGNLYELTATIWGPLADARIEPTPDDDGVPSRVSRGGSFYNSEDAARCSKREHMAQDMPSYRTGLRPARSIGEADG